MVESIAFGHFCRHSTQQLNLLSILRRKQIVWFDFDANWSIYTNARRHYYIEINMSANGYAYCIFVCPYRSFFRSKKMQKPKFKMVFFLSKHLRRQLACRLKFSWSIFCCHGFFSTSDSRMAWAFFCCSSMISKNNSNIWRIKRNETEIISHFKLNYGECEAQ